MKSPMFNVSAIVLTLLVVNIGWSATAAQKFRSTLQLQQQQPTTTEAANVPDVQTYRPVGQFVSKFSSGNANAATKGGQFKKTVKINRLSKEATSLAVEKLATTSTQYNSQSLVTNSHRFAPTAAAVSSVPTALPFRTTAAKLTASVSPGAAAFGRTTVAPTPTSAATAAATATTRAASQSATATAATAAITPSWSLSSLSSATASPTASPFRRVLRTSGTGAGNKYFASGAQPLRQSSSASTFVQRSQQDSQPQASLTKKSYAGNQFVDEEDADDYFSRRRARFLFKSRVGK